MEMTVCLSFDRDYTLVAVAIPPPKRVLFTALMMLSTILPASHAGWPVRLALANHGEKNCVVLQIAVQLSILEISNQRRMMPKNSSLMVRLDEESKALLASAAELRKVSVSDYVRSIVVGQARRELAAAEAQMISMTPEEQLEFWEALSKPPKLTKAQKRLGQMMRGEI